MLDIVQFSTSALFVVGKSIYITLVMKIAPLSCQRF